MERVAHDSGGTLFGCRPAGKLEGVPLVGHDLECLDGTGTGYPLLFPSCGPRGNALGDKKPGAIKKPLKAAIYKGFVKLGETR